MLTRWRLATPARLSLLFVLVAGTLLAALGWLWHDVLEEERRATEREQTERLENAALVLSHEIGRALDAWQAPLTAALTGDDVAAPSGTTMLIVDESGAARTAGVPLPFLPAVQLPPAAESPLLARALAAEYRTKDLAQAATLYEQAAAGDDLAVRATALTGLARVLRRLEQPRAALEAYDALAALGDAPVGGRPAVRGDAPVAGFPARLVADRERADVLRLIGDEAAADRASARLAATLAGGAIRLDRATFEAFLEVVPHAVDLPSVPVAQAADDLWPRWRQRTGGRAVTMAGGPPVVALWLSKGAVTAALVGPLEPLMASLTPAPRDLSVTASVGYDARVPLWGGDLTGRVIAARPVPGFEPALQLVVASDASIRAVPASRRTLLSAGFLLLALLIGAASFTVYRSVARELGVARLQSDFVAAVSHEFRSPLTAMRHLTDVLEEGSASSDRLPQYHAALGRETRRLHDLVEHLLDFGRFQGGRQAFRLEPDDAARIARAVAAEFAAGARETSRAISVAASDEAPVAVDRAAIALALHNLVDNAVKYSPAGSPVAVTVGRRDGRVAIAVIDQGAGIPPEEQRRVFGQFVRGSAAIADRVKGTGIGLTLADRIVRGHGGRIDVQSEPGAAARSRSCCPAVIPRGPSRARAPSAVRRGGGAPRH
jgi:two-component system phosphate regulon sensor histidine kinase PhoR